MCSQYYEFKVITIPTKAYSNQIIFNQIFFRANKRS